MKRYPLGILYRINRTSPSNGQCHVDLSMAHACVCVYVRVRLRVCVVVVCGVCVYVVRVWCVWYVVCGV